MSDVPNYDTMNLSGMGGDYASPSVDNRFTSVLTSLAGMAGGPLSILSFGFQILEMVKSTVETNRETRKQTGEELSQLGFEYGVLEIQDEEIQNQLEYLSQTMKYIDSEANRQTAQFNVNAQGAGMGGSTGQAGAALTTIMAGREKEEINQVRRQLNTQRRLIAGKREYIQSQGSQYGIDFDEDEEYMAQRQNRYRLRFF